LCHSQRKCAAGKITQFSGLIGKEGAEAIEGLLKSASDPAEKPDRVLDQHCRALSVGTTSTFAELQSDLDRIWRAPAASRPSGILGLLRTRLWSFGLIVSSGGASHAPNE